jgi:hypothetical protein
MRRPNMLAGKTHLWRVSLAPAMACCRQQQAPRCHGRIHNFASQAPPVRLLARQPLHDLLLSCPDLAKARPAFS